MDLLNEQLRLLIESLAESQIPISMKDADESIGKGLMSLEIPFNSGAIFRILISKKILKREIEDARRKEIQYWRGPGKHLDEHVDDAGLLSSMHKETLNAIILKYQYLYCTPLHWTHRHEKVLHVVWQPCETPLSMFLPQPPASQCQCNQLGSFGRQFNQLKYLLLQKFRYDVQTRPEWQSWWIDQSEPQFTPLLDESGSLARTPSRSLGSDFALINEPNSMVFKAISYLRDPFAVAPCRRPQDAMQLLLSGVDKIDTIKTFDRFLDCQNFLRLELRSLDIMYDQKRFKFLPKVPVYSLDTKRFGDTSFKTEELWEKESCWRMAHIDYAHISDGTLYYRKNTKNFFKYGFREGMSLSEYRDRYQQGYGDEDWSHPHFIPGLFIAMSQTYQRHQYRRWARNNSGKRDHKGKTNDTHDMYDDEQGGASVSSNGIPESHKSRSVPADHTDSTWQILLTDGPNDKDFAHLYTTNVPSFIIASFASPSKLHFSVPPTETQQNSAAGCGSESGEKKECEYEDASFDFLICHTKIAYEPQNTFRQRLREAITFARDSYRYQRKDTCLSVSYADKCLQSPEEMFLRREWEAQMNVYWEKTTQKIERRTFVYLPAFL